MELRHLRYLVAVVDEQSFVRAARRLHLSQPPLSRQIRDLEEELGVTLLERGHSGTTPTAAGQVFAEGARRLLAEVDRLSEHTRRVAAGHEGRLSIGYSMSAGPVLVEALRGFRELHPEVDVTVTEMHGGAQARSLEQGAVEVALGYRLPALEGFEATRLFEDPLFLAVPEGCSDVKGLPLLTLPLTVAPSFRGQLMEALAEAGILPSEVRDEASARSVLTLVGCGVGFGVMPWAIAGSGAPGVRFERLPHPLTLDTYAFTAKRSPAVDRFLTELQTAAPLASNA